MAYMLMLIILLLGICMSVLSCVFARATYIKVDKLVNPDDYKKEKEEEKSNED